MHIDISCYTLVMLYMLRCFLWHRVCASYVILPLYIVFSLASFMFIRLNSEFIPLYNRNIYWFCRYKFNFHYNWITICIHRECCSSVIKILMNVWGCNSGRPEKKTRRRVTQEIWFNKCIIFRYLIYIIWLWSNN